jgi:hypothetical protein
MSIYGVKNISPHYNGKKHLKNMTDGQVENLGGRKNGPGSTPTGPLLCN